MIDTSKHTIEGIAAAWGCSAEQLREFNRVIEERFEAYMREELPKQRAALLAGNEIPRTAIDDCLVTEDEVRAMGFTYEVGSDTWTR